MHYRIVYFIYYYVHILGVDKDWKRTFEVTSEIKECLNTFLSMLLYLDCHQSNNSVLYI